MAQSARASEAPSSGTAPGETISPWEWAVALVGVLVVLGAMGFLGYEAIVNKTGPPAVTVRADAVHATQGGYLVQIRASNQGGATAAKVLVQGVLTNASGDRAETSETLFDYVPAHSSRAGGLFFTQDPHQFQLQLRAQGYVEP
jgi:uncharacterized protein (TIGR02588 family)